MFGKLFKKECKPEAALTATPEAGSVPSAPSKGKVLVVDDDAVVRKTLSIKLSTAGYEVLEAADGSTALSTVRAQNPDVILTDIFLLPEPGMAWDGFSLMQWLKRPHDGVPIPFIVITGSVMGGEAAKMRDKALAAGAAGFFQKPLDMPALLATVEKLVPVSSKSSPA